MSSKLEALSIGDSAAAVLAVRNGNTASMMELRQSKVNSESDYSSSKLLARMNCNQRTTSTYVLLKGEIIMLGIS